jgi:uncharacterized protein YndB with AHSA1/START domain
MPTARRKQTIEAPAEELWEIVSDPHHLPRWWPRVARVEDVDGWEFTEVLKTKKGKVVRADFDIVDADAEQHRMAWSQRIRGTPFERVLRSSETQVLLAPASTGARGEATEVTIELRQALNGFFARFGGFMVRRAAGATLGEALEGLKRISG